MEGKISEKKGIVGKEKERGEQNLMENGKMHSDNRERKKKLRDPALTFQKKKKKLGNCPSKHWPSSN